ncbi:MAG: ATP-binding protein [Candidatus Hodarchaeota archaeon]
MVDFEMSSLKDWWRDAEFHDDLLHREIDEVLFAADLGYVVREEGAEIYRNPEKFFQRTYLTKGMKDLLKVVLLRISSQPDGKAVINLQTPFGGGKTHSLIALYHFFARSSQISHLSFIEGLLAEVKLDSIPNPKVAVLIGTALKILGESKPDGTVVKTLWGELVYQLGGPRLFSKVQKYDEQLVAPGTKDLAEIFNEVGPTVILIDEILTYISLIGAHSQNERTISTEQVLAFFQVLSIAVSNSASASLVITFPQTRLERFGKEAETALEKLNKIFGRLKYNLTPVEGIEIFDVIKRRIFQYTGNPEVCQKSVEEYWKFYQAHNKELPAKIQRFSKHFSYKDLMVKAYPFHPELIEILYEQWEKLPGFQSTRGLLRLLTLCSVQIAKEKRSGALILPSHIDLAVTTIRKEILDIVGFSFREVIETDISGSAAIAKRLDQSLGSEFADARLAEGLATALFLYSHPNPNNEGIAESFLRFAIYHPNSFPSLVSDVLMKLCSKREGLWYLYKTSTGQFLFKDQKNLVGRSIAYQERVSIEKIQALIDENLAQIIGDKKIFKIYKYPRAPADVPDTRQRIHRRSHLSLCILSFEQSFESTIEKEIQIQIEEIFNFKGISKTPRDYRNTLVFIAPSKTGYGLVEKTAKEILAFQMIYDVEKHRLTSTELETLNHWLKESKSQLPQVILTAYRHILVGGKDGKLKAWDLGPHAYEVKLQLTERVFEFLVTQEKLLKKLDPRLLISKRWNMWSDPQTPINVLDLWEMFARYTFLPMLASKKVLEETLFQGVSKDLFLVGEGKDAEMAFEKIFHQNNMEQSLSFSEKTWLIHKTAFFRTKCPKCQTWIEFAGFSKFLCQFCSGSTPKPLEAIPVSKDIDKEIISSTTSISSPEKIHEVYLETILNKKDWQSFLRGVLNPLGLEGDQIEIQIKMTSHEGFNRNTLDLAVKETLSQLNLKVKFETK